MQADDLMAAVFPDAAACLENIPGDREVPDHPLVNQTVRDCLEEAMDFEGLKAVLARIHAGELRLVARDTPEPSAFAHDILNARPYAFLDDAPLEERRAHAVQTRRAGDAGGEHAALDVAAIERVRDEERPDPRDADELHDVLLTTGCLPVDLVAKESAEALAAASRAALASISPAVSVWVAAERLPELLALHPGAVLEPRIVAPASRLTRTWTREEAAAELVRGRLSFSGPMTASELDHAFAMSEAEVEAALLALEADGVILRGNFSPGANGVEWCDRRLLARIHRYTLDRLRAEISPVAPADFMRFLFAWQHVTPLSQLTGIDGLRAVLAQLDGLELPARAWEAHVLPARLDKYEPAMLDMLCFSGELGWARLSAGPAQVVGATPIALFRREHEQSWFAMRSGSAATSDFSDAATRVLETLRAHGASFAHQLASACGLDDEQLQAAIGELVSAGLAASDGFTGLRALIGTLGSQSPARVWQATSAGRWSALPVAESPTAETVDAFAWSLLHRYGVVFRRTLTRESTGVPWRDLARVYRRLEARGEIRGGRFVSGMSGEQFALPDAVERLREVRRTAHDDRLIAISAADPLNLTGIITPGERIRAVAATRIVFRNGVPIAAMEGDILKSLERVDPEIARDAAALAAGRRVPVVTGYVGRLR
jgi:ATP-dependent Lhr-like helicase